MPHDLALLRERGFRLLTDAYPHIIAGATEAFLRAQLAQAKPPLDRRGQYPLETRLSPRLWDIPRALAPLLKEALGSDRLYMHMPPMARFVLPRNEHAAVPAHQDIAYNQHLPPFLTVWCPLVEIDGACGGVTMFEGRRDAEETTKGEDWLEPVSTEGLIPHRCVPMLPGDILIFDPLTVHQSQPNVSKRVRFSVDYRFFAEPLSTKHYLDMQEWKVVAP